MEKNRIRPITNGKSMRMGLYLLCGGYARQRI